MHRIMSFWLIVLAIGGVSDRALAGKQSHHSTQANVKAHVEDKRQGYVSPDGKLRATVIGVGKPGQAASESRIEVRTAHGKPVAQASYVSPDGEHGAGVVRAAWTPDSQFFVWSTESSGGHSPWHWPTYFFSRRLNKIFSLDDIVGAITTGSFTIKAPDIVQSRRMQGQNIQGVPFTQKLSTLRPVSRPQGG